MRSSIICFVYSSFILSSIFPLSNLYNFLFLSFLCYSLFLLSILISFFVFIILCFFPSITFSYVILCFRRCIIFPTILYVNLYFVHLSSSLLSFHYLFFMIFSFCLSLYYSLALSSFTFFCVILCFFLLSHSLSVLPYVILCFFLLSPSLMLVFVFIILSLSLSVFPYVILLFHPLPLSVSLSRSCSPLSCSLDLSPSVSASLSFFNSLTISKVSTLWLSFSLFYVFGCSLIFSSSSFCPLNSYFTTTLLSSLLPSAVI